MRRVLRWTVVALAGIAIAIVGLILEGGMLERMFAIGEVPVVDFATLQRASTPNQFLLCPTDLCRTQTDGVAPVFDLSVEQLRAAWEQMVAEQPRGELLRRDVTNLQLDYVQRTRLLRFPDLVTVRFIPIDDAHATLAIYSRSIYGKGDLGVNHARIDDWLAKLKARIG
ncbi:MAG TPA: DUF1499 domain-containing protein [Dongiaceae bacterium]